MNAWEKELSRRMSGPQRHRLLQGYPMLPLMRAAGRPTAKRSRSGIRRTASATTEPDAARTLTSIRLRDSVIERQGIDAPPFVLENRPLIIGILPHTQCNPRVEGCGFCTFPHDSHNKWLMQLSASVAVDQIVSLFEANPELARRRVDGVYFGGATANLTPKLELRAICNALAKRVDLGAAEVTLEGVPTAFRSLLPGPFEVLLELQCRHRRISMGVQTFDPQQIARMGRQGFGDRRAVARTVEKAHRHGVTASGDFLINLPDEPRARMLDDVREAAALGFDQICVYHLVLTPEQDTPWARDPALLAALPAIEDACANWLAVRDWLLTNGFVQTTLTNFERSDIHDSNRRFLYEDCSFAPEHYDALGFGPHAISTFVSPTARRAVKLVRGKSLSSSGATWTGDDLYFDYDEADLRLLYLTRTLARCRVPRSGYHALFGAHLVDHFGEPLAAVQQAGLATLDATELVLTPRGMFYADSVAGLLAWSRTEALRQGGSGRHTRDVLRGPLAIDEHLLDPMG